MNKRLQALIFSATLVTWSVANAAPTGALAFITPTGTVSPTDVIDVWVRLTLDSGSAPLQLDSTLPGLGVNPADIPAEWVSLTGAYTNTSFLCSGTFTTRCDGPPYDFSFNASGPDSFNFLADITIDPGESRDYLFGSFTPSAGSVAPGTYTFYNAKFFLVLDGLVPQTEPQLDENGNPVLDENGNPVVVPVLDENGDPVLLPVEQSLSIAETCPTQTSDCAFTRTVSAVPLPAAAWLFGSGLLGLIGVARRRR